QRASGHEPERFPALERFLLCSLLVRHPGSTASTDSSSSDFRRRVSPRRGRPDIYSPALSSGQHNLAPVFCSRDLHRRSNAQRARRRSLSLLVANSAQAFAPFELPRTPVFRALHLHPGCSSARLPTQYPTTASAKPDPVARPFRKRAPLLHG